MSPSTQEQIKKDMTIEEIFSNFPQKSQKLAQEITNAGLECVGCQASSWETLEAGMLGHGYSEVDVDSLVKRLNAVLAETSDLSSITMTPKAVKKYLEILEEEGKQGFALRFGYKAGGCSGYEYILDYSQKKHDDDEVFTSHGLEIHVNKNMVPKLIGCVIDFVDGLHGSGFKISNPNAKASCGCGKSQSY